MCHELRIATSATSTIANIAMIAKSANIAES
jgi:hypothetical protein